MNKNLAIFFNDGENGCLWKIQDGKTNFKKGFGECSTVIFKQTLDEETKKQIKEAKNVFAYVYPYFSDAYRIEKNGISLKNVLYSLCALANELPNTNIFILPYTIYCAEVDDWFYTHFERFYRETKTTPPENLFVHKSSVGVHFDYYVMERHGARAKRISLNKNQFDVIYEDLFRQYKTATTDQNIGDGETASC